MARKRVKEIQCEVCGSGPCEYSSRVSIVRRAVSWDSCVVGKRVVEPEQVEVGQ
jgi:hypothetical protein